MTLAVIPSMLLRDRVVLVAVENAAICFPSFDKCSSLFTNSLCLDRDLEDQPVYKLRIQHLPPFLLSKELGTVLCWPTFSFTFYTQPKKRNWPLRIYMLSLTGSRRHKQLFCVALHLLCVLLISSRFALVMYDTVKALAYPALIQLGVFVFTLCQINVQRVAALLKGTLLF